jgi:Protein of unknown function (DUF3303)
MKVIVQWTTRFGSEPKDNVKSSESLLKAFGTWEPPEEWTIIEFLACVDGRGGQVICETSDIASIGRTVAQYVAWVDLGLKGWSQHCAVRPIVGGRRVPRRVSSSGGSCGVAC